ncbi:disease resistance protein (TIR-NBS-LRR class), putative [Medicago truncatula]|uniref:Disease resistance protein (TIR-NBS-LRR class), putative n=2 Tax=Medicago truncatula TaxID=3880 RepID=A0A072U0K1_MEDTR|nr:disease resistance protein (TIR-NBS-LRR class), putative [Medicago truncatula]
MSSLPFDLLSDGAGTSSSSSKDYGSIENHKYDVFISFRGSETRNSFVDHLHSHLVRKGIFTFKDDKQLQKGEAISPQLLQAIRRSRVCIIVFSRDYASSTWCLDEMAAIDESRKKLKQVVFPVFYDVDPSHVRKQNGVYENAFVLHTKQFGNNSDKVAQWRTTMTHLAGSAGWDVRNRPEFGLIEEMTDSIIEKLGHSFSGSADDLIGIQPHIEALESLLKQRPEHDGCRVLGIWGMDGIGKTTLATVLYDRISYQFDACCFVENVSKFYENGGAIAVQKQILCRTIEEKNIDTYSPPKISQIMRNRLRKIKLLIVLDNVEQIEQLEELDIKPKFLHTKSRIIAITRDKHILQAYGADEVFEAKLMTDEDAYKLLCRKAFKSDYASSGFAELIPEVLIYAQRLPLAVRVLGSFLFSRNARQWSLILDKIEKNPPNKIMKVLHVSFEELEQDEKEIFLHVACFFNGERKDYVSRILNVCGLNPDIDIPLLVEKSLITIRNDEIHMHEMLCKLGKQIVQEQHPDEPKSWSRMWLYRDFHHAMITNSEAIKAKTIILNKKEDVSKFNKLRAEDLSKMEKLEVLILYHTNFSGKPICLSDSLRYVLWNGYPFMSLPSNFQPHHLEELNMPDSSIEQLWIGTQHLPNLKRMDLSNSKNLKMTPCFEGVLNLERLDLSGCINLSQVDSSIGLLTKLVFLSLQNCRNLVNLDFGNAATLWSLKVLCLSDCTKLENTPDFSGLSILQYLDMD